MRISFSFLLLGLVLFILHSCGVKRTSQVQNLQTSCCQECLEAFSQSPVGVGAEAARCGFFSTSFELSAPCQKFFQEQEIMVSACQ